MTLLSNIYTDINMLSSTSTVVFFKANRRTDAAQVLIKLFRIQEDSDGSTRIKTIVSFTELLTVTSMVLGTVSAVREIDSGFIIEYALPPHATIQLLSDYLLTKRSIMARESGRRTRNLEQSSRIDNTLVHLSTDNYDNQYSISDSCSPTSLGAGAWCVTPRYSRQASKSRSIRSRSRATSVSTEWKSIVASIDNWRERIVWQLLAQLVRGLSDFYKAPDSLRAGLTPNIYPEAIFVVTDPCTPSNLELTILACILDPYMLVPVSIYRAPELFRDAKKGYPADIWALGCIAFELVAQRKPRFDPSKLIKDPVLQNIDCSPNLLELITSCCRVNPSERPCLADLMKSKIIRTIMTHMFATVHTKSELTLVNKLDLTRINMRRVPGDKYFRPTYSEVPVLLSNPSESSDSLSITDILDIHSSSTGSGYAFPLTYYASNVRTDTLGKQTITWEYDTLDFSPEIDEYISKRRLLSFLLLPDSSEIISRAASSLMPFLTSFEAIKQLCDLSFDGIALELENELTIQETNYLLANIDVIWNSILSVSYVRDFLLKSNYFIERIINEIDSCALWVIEKNNSIATIKNELYCIYTILFNLYTNNPHEFCACFLVNNTRCNSLLSSVFDTHISKLVGSILTEGYAPPFVITEAYQFFNCSMLKLAARLDSFNPAELGGHILLIINLSRELLSAISKQLRPTIDPTTLLPIISTIKAFIPNVIPFKILIQYLTTNLLSISALFLIQELNSGVYSPTGPIGIILSKLFLYFNGCFEELLKHKYASNGSTFPNHTIQLIVVIDQLCQIFMLLPHIQRKHLTDIGLFVCSDAAITNFSLKDNSSMSEGGHHQSTSEIITDYIGQVAYIGLGTPNAWDKATSSFKSAFSLLQEQFIYFAKALLPHIAQITLNSELSTCFAIQFSLCRLRSIFLDLELQSSLPLGQMLLDSSFFSRLQYYITIFTQNSVSKPLCITNFKQQHPEVVYLLATAKRLLYLTLGMTDFNTIEEYITNNLQGHLYEYLEKLKRDIFNTVTKLPSVDLDLAKTFIQILTR